MLNLVNINKTYKTGDTTTEALRKISIQFRKSEFVSILGPSGCGKTTLLNIIGGLDRYNSGNLIINGKSTKNFTDKDWDTYRNHSIGFVFQSYNLIPHLNVLENVELALTLSGVSKKQRRERAEKVLKQVGLKDKLQNKPSQLSGGQMQRVAIARALVNDPDIILADEPTGALDSKTSIQIMEILKEISNEKLIIMVTHNPELAETYSSRIVKLKDGKVVDDSNPLSEEEIEQENEIEKELNENAENNVKKSEKNGLNKSKKSKMSFWTAFSLSFKNLLTKKARTILVSFAGSIGIIGIALVLAISSGFNTYVSNVQKETLSSYPVEINNSSYDFASLMQMFMSSSDSDTENDGKKVYVKKELTTLLSKFNASSQSNDVASFKVYIENDGKEKVKQYTSAVQYIYPTKVNPYYNVGSEYVNTNSIKVFNEVINNYIENDPEINVEVPLNDKSLRARYLQTMFKSGLMFDSSFWSEMIENREVLSSQYELVGEGSHWATNYDEIMIVLDKNSQLSDYTLYALGLLDQSGLYDLMDSYINNKESPPVTATYEFSDILNLQYDLVLESDYFEKQSDDTYKDIRTMDNFQDKLSSLISNEKSIKLKVAGIVRLKEDASGACLNTAVVYNKALTQYIANQNNEREIVALQLQNDTKNIITGENFSPINTKAMALSKLGYVDLTSPSGIYLYPVNFDSKAKIMGIIDEYNQICISHDEKEKVITYSDTMGTLMGSISTIISSITYVLIAFVGVSLIVSSIMIGIITYISVIERKKEIGVLRSIGASKRDIKHVFTSESFIIGLASGLLGIIISLILLIPVNLILNYFTALNGLAMLPWIGAIVLVLVSVGLTFIAGLIPSNAAAKKDPVIALREV